MDYRQLNSGDLDALLDVTRTAFGNYYDIPATEAFGGLEIDRFYGAFEGGELVGGLGAYSLSMRVPDGELDVGGTTVAVVLPTHRRRGVLTRLMELHFEDAHDRGEPALALWASETGIYGRFGYGRAFDRLEVDVDQDAVAHPGIGDTTTVSFVDGADERLRTVWAKLRSFRPGVCDRSERWWQHEIIYDPPAAREGYSPYRFALVEEDGEPAGYTRYRAKLDMPGNFRLAAELQVEELHAVSDVAEAALWRFLVEHDLVRRVHMHGLPTDSIVDSVLVDHRTAHRRLVEGGWMRLLDLGDCLEARGYAEDGEISFAVTDDQIAANNGTWRLEVNGGRGRLSTTDSAPDIRCHVSALGATYFGARRWRSLAAGGLVEGAPAAIRKADELFFHPVAPWFDHF